MLVVEYDILDCNFTLFRILVAYKLVCVVTWKTSYIYYVLCYVLLRMQQ